jgi:hypothetical protein
MRMKSPKDIMLLADPSPRLVDEYLKRGECFVAEEQGQFIGVYVTLLTRPDTIEFLNPSNVYFNNFLHFNKKFPRLLFLCLIKSYYSMGLLYFT